MWSTRHFIEQPTSFAKRTAIVLDFSSKRWGINRDNRYPSRQYGAIEVFFGLGSWLILPLIAHLLVCFALRSKHPDSPLSPTHSCSEPQASSKPSTSWLAECFLTGKSPHYCSAGPPPRIMLPQWVIRDWLILLRVGEKSSRSRNVALWADGTYKVTGRQRYMAGCIGIADSPNMGARIKAVNRSTRISTSCPSNPLWLAEKRDYQFQARQRKASFLFMSQLEHMLHARCSNTYHQSFPSSCPNAFNIPPSFNSWYQRLFSYSNDLYEFFLIRCRHDWIDCMRANINR